MEKNKVNLPCFYFNSSEIVRCTKRYQSRNFLLNYSVKACLFDGLVTRLGHFVDGFSVSSVNELIKTRSETKKPIHFVSPLIRQHEVNYINSLANSVAFNSLEQFDRFKKNISSHVKIFLRINPEISIVKDAKYNPCRKYSKLGVPLKDLKQYLSCHNNHSITGLQFHTACQEKDINQILKVLEKIKKELGKYYFDFHSVNLGGGYLYSKSNFNKLQTLRKKYGQNFTIEPGFDLVNSSGYLISSVTDLFKRDGKKIAVLDTSINHLPEVFEYNFSPDVLDTVKNERCSYVLVGASCLAGDVFGEYYFKKPLQLGSKVIFKNVGSYSIVKAHRFNGLELPQVLMSSRSIKDVTQTLEKSDYEDQHDSMVFGEAT